MQIRRGGEAGVRLYKMILLPASRIAFSWFASKRYLAITMPKVYWFEVGLVHCRWCRITESSPIFDWHVSVPASTTLCA